MPHRGRERAATGRDRAVDNRPQRVRLLIVCEGTQTEPNYFRAMIQALRLNGRVDSHVVGTGRNTLSLIKFAEEKQTKEKIKYDEVWCVFDKDSFPDADFDNAIAQTHNHNYLRAAWTNEAFELWYILHFEFRNSSPAGPGGRPRDHYGPHLTALLKKHGKTNEYKKNDTKMYALLEPYTDEAIKNARKLEAHYPEHTPCHQRKPATTVHKLVETLRGYAAAI